MSRTHIVPGKILLLVVAFVSCHSIASTPSCVAPPAGLVGWWRGEANANDITGTNHGRLLNGATYGVGNIGLAFRLDGTNQYASAPASPSLNVGAGEGFTIEGWIFPTVITRPAAIVEFDRAGAYGLENVGVQFGLSAGAPGCLWANVVDASGKQHFFATPGNLLRASNWSHVALSYSRSGVANLYVGGFAVAQTNLGSLTHQTAFDLLIGASTALGSPAAPTNAFAGRIDEISIYNRKLSSAELGQIVSAGTAGKCLSAPPLAVYELAGDFSTNRLYT